jgi:hypothetical protein
LARGLAIGGGAVEDPASVFPGRLIGGDPAWSEAVVQRSV